MLRVRSVKRGSLTVHSTILPRQVCLCRHYSCKDRAEFTNRLRNTHVAAARTGKLSMIGRIFSVHTDMERNVLDVLCCSPMEDDFDGPERMEFAETPALCIYYRDPYSCARS